MSTGSRALLYVGGIALVLQALCADLLTVQQMHQTSAIDAANTQTTATASGGEEQSREPERIGVKQQSDVPASVAAGDGQDNKQPGFIWQMEIFRFPIYEASSCPMTSASQK